MTKHYFVWWAWCITEVEEGGCWTPAGVAESSRWQRGRREVESVSVLAGWHGYHGTNSPGTEKTAANRRAASERNRLSSGQCRACCPCPCRYASPTCNQRAKEPTRHQGHTDGPLLGGCGCNADLRAKAVLFATACVHIHTTAWQSNMLAFLCQAKIQHWEQLNYK